MLRAGCLPAVRKHWQPAAGKRMRFKLVYDGFYFVMQEKVLQAFIRETRNPDSPDASLFIEPLHRPPCGIVIPVGFVHQVEVEVVQPEFFIERSKARRASSYS